MSQNKNDAKSEDILCIKPMEGVVFRDVNHEENAGSDSNETYVTGPAKTGHYLHMHATTEIHFCLYMSYTHALPRNIKYSTIDGQVCFLRWPFANADEPRGCIS